MQITVPSTIENNPLIVTLAGVSYKLAPGETITVPDAIAEELYRMIAAKNHPAPGVEPPFEVDATNKAIENLQARMAVVEAAIAVPELPEFPETDGTYGLQLVMDTGEGTLTWEAAAEGETTPET